MAFTRSEVPLPSGQIAGMNWWESRSKEIEKQKIQWCFQNSTSVSEVLSKLQLSLPFAKVAPSRPSGTILGGFDWMWLRRVGKYYTNTSRNLLGGQDPGKLSRQPLGVFTLAWEQRKYFTNWVFVWHPVPYKLHIQRSCINKNTM